MNNHILIVDDNLNNLRVAVDILINEEYRITTARNGIEALSALAKTKMDLILLDINMPEMDGFETIAEIKKNPSWCDIPVLFVTSHREEDFLDKAYKAGCVDFIIKPFRPTEFLARIQTHHSLSLHKRKLNRLVEEKTTELNATITELKTSKKAKDDFLSVMSHELRTPLSGILGMIELLKIPSMHESHRDFLKDLEISSHKLAKLITDILDFSTIDEPLVQNCNSPISLEYLIALVKRYSSTLEKNHVHFSLQTSSTVPSEMSFDFSSCLRALECLIDNAIKFTTQGEVKLSISFKWLSKNNGLLNFSVTDSGPGIPEEFRDKIFEKFFQIDSGVNRLYEGTGLGLAIANKICKANHSTLSLESTSEEGSTFTISVLCSTDAKTDQTKKKKVSEATLLIVEDLPTNQLFLKKILSLKKCNVIIAENHHETFRVLEDITPDLIFMDYMLPEMNGTEICAEIRQRGHTIDSLPIIAVTAKADDESRETCIKSGMNTHISKPYSAKDIYEVLARYFDLS